MRFFGKHILLLFVCSKLFSVYKTQSMVKWKLMAKSFCTFTSNFHVDMNISYEYSLNDSSSSSTSITAIINKSDS